MKAINKNNDLILNDLLFKLFNKKNPKSTSLTEERIRERIPANLTNEIADEVLNELLKECFNEKDFDGMRVIVKMKNALKELDKNEYSYINK